MAELLDKTKHHIRVGKNLNRQVVKTTKQNSLSRAYNNIKIIIRNKTIFNTCNTRTKS